jgi:ankyrin repeat protein
MDCTALHKAAASGHETAARLLLERGAVVDAREEDQWTALHLAAQNGHEATVRLLLERGADIGATEARQWTALHKAAANGRETTARLLLERGAVVDAREEHQLTALHLAAQNGHEATVRLLLECGADIGATEARQWTALHLAALKGHEAAVGFLLDRGAKIDQTDALQWTALHLATHKGHQAIAALLLDCGAEMNAMDDDGRTPAALARDGGHTKLLAEFARRGILPPPVEKPEMLQSASGYFLHFTNLEGESSWLADNLNAHSSWLTIPAADRLMQIAPLPFWPGASLLAIEHAGLKRRREQFALIWPGESFIPLDWSNAPIYRAIELHPIETDDLSVATYVRFFLNWVRAIRAGSLLSKPSTKYPGEEIPQTKSKHAWLRI